MGSGDSCARLHTAAPPHRTPVVYRHATREQAIKASGETTKLVFFRGPTMFLYGPTKPDDDWYKSNLL